MSTSARFVIQIISLSCQCPIFNKRGRPKFPLILLLFISVLPCLLPPDFLPSLPLLLLTIQPRFIPTISLSFQLPIFDKGSTQAASAITPNVIFTRLILSICLSFQCPISNKVSKHNCLGNYSL